MSGDHKVVAVTDGAVDYSLFNPMPDLPVIDEDASFEQCQDWSFIVELLQDIVGEREARVEELQSALQANDPVKFHRTAHAIKGAALNLHLPALVDVSKRAEALGKQLEVELTKRDQKLLAQRQPLIEALQLEYDRLEGYIPQAQAKAEEEEGGGGGEGEDEEGYDDEYQQNGR